jgi:hypothetical protein
VLFDRVPAGDGVDDDLVDVARPMLGWRNEYFVQWAHVRNLVPHNSLYNYGRMLEVWLDR